MSGWSSPHLYTLLQCSNDIGFQRKGEGDVWGSPQDFGKGEPQGQGRSSQGYDPSTYQ